MATARVLSFELPSVTTETETTHEAFVQAIRDVVADRVADAAARERLTGAKLVYGAGVGGIRGICYYEAWDNGQAREFIEISARGQESNVQLAGTTVHELAHALAGHGCGHGPEWKAACRVLGLSVAQAAGQAYSAEHFAPDVWETIASLPQPSDGRPAFNGTMPRAPRGAAGSCPMGIGSRGGRSRGPGSGSRLRLWVCGCAEGTPGRKVRVASDTWDATCNRCGLKYGRG